MLMPFAFQGKIRVPGGQQAFRGVSGGNIDPAPVCPLVLGWIRFGELRSAFKKWSSKLSALSTHPKVFDGHVGLSSR